MNRISARVGLNPWMVIAGLSLSSIAYAQQAVFVVRHAEKVDGSAESALDEVGKQRALRLTHHLERAGVSAIVTSEFRRCKETAAPLAEALEISSTVVSATAYDELARTLRTEHADDVVLVVGHSNTLPGILRALGYPDEVEIEGYTDLFVVIPQAEGPPTVLRLSY